MAAGLSTAAAVLMWGQMEDRSGGTFRVRSSRRAELRAPVAGFLREVRFDEGDIVSPGDVVLRMEVSDLDSRIAQSSAVVREVEAKGLAAFNFARRPSNRPVMRHWRFIAGSPSSRMPPLLAP